MAAPDPEAKPTPAKIDTEQLVRFLTLLGKNGHTKIRGFRRGTKERPGDAKNSDWNLGELQRWQAIGLNSYLVVNEGGHGDGDITSCPAMFAEWDGCTVAEQLVKVEAAIAVGFPQPTFAVRTNPTDEASLHLYWVLTEPVVDVSRWRLATWRLIAALKSDVRVENPSRVMRLPGCMYFSKKTLEPLGQSSLMEGFGSGERVNFEAMEAALRKAEATTGLNPWAAIPENKRKTAEQQQQLVDVITRSEGEEAAVGFLDFLATTTKPVRAKNTSKAQAKPAGKAKEEAQKADGLISEEMKAALQAKQEAVVAYCWALDQKELPLERVVEALAFIPQRAGGGTGTYAYYRDLLWGLVDCCDQQVAGLTDPLATAIEVMEAHSPSATCGWDIPGTAPDCNGSYTLKTFWFKVTEAGWRPTEKELKDAEPTEGAQLEYAHFTITEMVDAGADPAEVQRYINGNAELGAYGLSKFAEAARARRDNSAAMAAALDAVFKKGDLPVIELETYLGPVLAKQLQPMMRGLRFPPSTLVLTIVTALAAAIPPQWRACTATYGISEPILMWLLLVGVSGTAKSVLLNRLVLKPVKAHVLPVLDQRNERRLAAWQASCDAYETDKAKNPRPGPKPRSLHYLYTSASTQGIKADAAANGAVMPALMARDEITGWLKDMVAGSHSASDVEFYLSAYDQAISSERFGDEKFNREVRECKLSIIGGIQPRVLDQHLPAGLDNGFFSRPLMAHLPADRKELVADPYVGALQQTLGGIYANLLNPDPSSSGVPPEVKLTLTSEAETLFKQLFDRLESYRIDSTSDAIGALWAKGSGQLLRLAGVLQWMRIVLELENPLESEEQLPETAGHAHDYKCVPITSTTLLLAMDLLLVGKATSQEIHQNAEDPRMRMAARFREVTDRLFRKHGKAPTIREVLKTGWSGKDRPTTEELVLLAQAGHAQRVLIYDAEAKTVMVRAPF